MVAEIVCVRPNGEWCLLDELRDYQDDGCFLDGDYEIMSYECMMNGITTLNTIAGKEVSHD